MPNFTIHRGSVKKILIILLIVCGFALILCGIGLWESYDQGQAMLKQEEFDEPAKRRREGWIEVDGQWYAPKADMQTMLIIGVDKLDPMVDSGSYNNDSQADFLMIAAIEPNKEEITILHINRDTMTKIPVLGVTGQDAGTIDGQLALAHTYGSGLQDSCKNTVKAVSGLLGGVQIDHYVSMTMGAVPLINDMVGGVTVTVLDDFQGIDDSLVKGQTMTLTGQQSIHYIRIRKGLEDSTNLNRMNRQQQYLRAFAGQMKSLGDSFAPSAEKLNELSGHVISDSSLTVLSDMSKRFSGYHLNEIESVKGEAKQGTEFVEFYPDEAALQKQVLDIFYELRK